jgi:hypothetical protein
MSEERRIQIRRMSLSSRTTKFIPAGIVWDATTLTDGASAERPLAKTTWHPCS